jgi:cyclomaltodextrinase / maltogenic alpha-amylase / neopullulanase
MSPTPGATDRPDWVADAVFYQIFPDRFVDGDPTNNPPDTRPWGSPPTRDHFQGGDLAGVLQRLDYLAGLGITGLWLNPVFAAGTNHRYDTHDYLRIDPALGDEGLLKELVQEAHHHGIKVILDGVFNHCGDGFWAFQDLVANGTRSPYRDWFIATDLPVRADPPNYQTCGGAPYLPKLNTANPEVRRHLLEVATHWIEVADIDGWRLDVPWKVPGDFWDEFRAVVKDAKPDAYLVGEIWRDATPWLDVFDGVMNYRLRDLLLDYCLHDHLDAEDVAFEIRSILAALGDAAPVMLNLLGSHDTPRLLTLADGSLARTQLALTALFTLPGAPLIYYGDELPLEGDNDPDCRRAMPADPHAWLTPTREHCRQLVQIRDTHPALRRGSFEPLLTLNGVLAYRRTLDGEDVVVVLNPRDQQRELTIPYPDGWPERSIRWTDLLTGRQYEASPTGIHLETLPATSARILVVAEQTP